MKVFVTGATGYIDGIEDLVRQYGEAGRYGMTSNSLVSAVNACRLGWSPKSRSLFEYFASAHHSGLGDISKRQSV